MELIDFCALVIFNETADKAGAGAAETINGLVGITDDKEIGCFIPGKELYQPVLHQVDILEFINQQPLILAVDLFPELLMIFKQQHREVYQIVQVEQVVFGKPVLIALGGLLCTFVISGAFIRRGLLDVSEAPAILFGLCIVYAEYFPDEMPFVGSIDN